MSWPIDHFKALETGEVIISNEKLRLSTVDCGFLEMPSGKLIACDPFVFLSKSDNPFFQIPPGKYQVLVTLADVSEALDGSHLREAYASLIINPEGKEITRKVLELTHDGKPSGEILVDGEYFGFGVDAGTACFTDALSISRAMPDDEESDWNDDIFDSGKDDSWFEMMDDEEHIREGIANIKLPLAKKGENIIIFHSGWGDGMYPVVGGYDSNGNLTAIHIDFFVLPHPEA